MTTDEKKKEFIRQLKLFSDFWSKNEKAKNVKEKIDGFIFSFLYLLDGKSDQLKDFVIAPGKEIEDNISGNLSDIYYLPDEEVKK